MAEVGLQNRSVSKADDANATAARMKVIRGLIFNLRNAILIFPYFRDTRLSNIGILELRRRQIIKRRAPTLPIGEQFYVLEDVSPRFFPCRVAMVIHELHFERMV